MKARLGTPELDRSLKYSLDHGRTYAGMQANSPLMMTSERGAEFSFKKRSMSSPYALTSEHDQKDGVNQGVQYGL